MGKKSTPAAPDYTTAAEKTAESSREVTDQQTWANRANQVNPWGTETWSSAQAIDPSTGKPVTQWTQNTTLNPESQHALDSQLALQSGRSDLANSLFPRAQAEFGQAVDYSGLTPWAQAPMQAGGLNAITNPYGFGGPRAGGVQGQYDYGGLQGVQGSGQARQTAEDAIYKSATSRLDPQWQQSQSDMESKLANQGVTQGSAAYQQAMDQFNRQKSDAYNQAQMSAVTGGGAEAQRNTSMDLALRGQQAGEAQSQGNLWNQAQAQRFGQGLQQGQYGLAQQQQAFGQQQAASGQNFQQQLAANQFQNTQRQQQLAEMMQQRGFSLNEINAIISGQQVGMPTFGGYNQAGASQGVDYSGAASNQYQASMDAYNAQQASSPLNAAAGLAGTAMKAYTGGMSDRRTKTDVRRIGTHARGFGVYAFRYIGGLTRYLGVMAQEVQKVLPEAVGSLRGVLMVDYSML